jgi:hypothetical protein
MEKNIFGLVSLIFFVVALLVWILNSFWPLFSLLEGSTTFSSSTYFVFPIIFALVVSILGGIMGALGLIFLKKFKIWNKMPLIGLILNIILTILVIVYPMVKV